MRDFDPRLLSEAQAADTAPARLMELARQPSAAVRAAVASHRRATAEILELVGLTATEVKVAEAVAQNPRTPPDVLEELASEAFERLVGAKLGGGRAFRAPPEGAPERALGLALEEQLGDAGWLTEILGPGGLRRELEPVRRAILHNPAAPEPLIQRLIDELIDSPDPQSRLAVAVHPACEPAQREVLLGDLCHSPDLEVRVMLAGHVETPPPTLSTLARQELEVADTPARLPLRRALAANPRTPPDALELLAYDWTSEVRAAVAGNPSAPPETYLHLAHDLEPDVRGALLRHPAIPASTLNAVLEGAAALARDAYVCWSRAASHPGLDAFGATRISQSHNGALRAMAAAHPSLPPTRQAELVDDPAPAVRLALARRPDLPSALLDKLGGDTSRPVRQAAQDGARS